MPRPPRLSDDELVRRTPRSAAVVRRRRRMRRTVELPCFRDAVAAIVAIADVAEEMDHHPDVDLRWRTLHLALVSHSAGGVTELDLELARRIDALLPG